MNRSFLLFQLYGLLASWGDIAVGEVRPSFDRPSKSAVLGLIAAAFGYRRTEETRHRELAESLGFALRLDEVGIYMQDYHTVQIPPKTGSWIKTRRDELTMFDYRIESTNKSNAATAIQSYRDYYADQYAVVCLWKLHDGGPSLELILKELKRPSFTLYLGRKSCPPALPLWPVIVKAENVHDAFLKAPHEQKRKEFLKAPSQQPARYFWEGGADEGFGEPDIQVERWDQPVSRNRWQFQPRSEYTKTL